MKYTKEKFNLFPNMLVWMNSRCAVGDVPSGSIAMVSAAAASATSISHHRHRI